GAPAIARRGNTGQRTGMHRSRGQPPALGRRTSLSVKTACRTRTYRTEPAIPRHLLSLFVKKGITPALSDVSDGRNREGNTSITAKIDLFWRFKGTMTSYLIYGPTRVCKSSLF